MPRRKPKHAKLPPKIQTAMQDLSTLGRVIDAEVKCLQQYTHGFIDRDQLKLLIATLREIRTGRETQFLQKRAEDRDVHRQRLTDRPYVPFHHAVGRRSPTIISMISTPRSKNAGSRASTTANTSGRSSKR